MADGMGIQSFSSKNLQLSNQNQSLSYKVQDGDTIDGDIASIVDQYGDDNLKNSIAQQHDKKNFSDLSADEQKEALLWFADKQSGQIAADSKIANPDSISAGDTLKLDHLLGNHAGYVDSEVDSFKGSVGSGNFAQINGYYTNPKQKQL